MVNKTNKSSENENSSDSDRKMTNNAFSQVLTSSDQQSVLSITSRQFNTHVVTFRRLSYNCFDNNEY